MRMCVFPSCKQSYLVHSYLKVLTSFEMHTSFHLDHIFLLDRIIRRSGWEPVGFVGPYITVLSLCSKFDAVYADCFWTTWLLCVGSEFTVVPFEDLSPTTVPSHLLGLMSFSNKKPWSEWRQCCMAWPPTRGHCGALKSSLTHLLRQSDRLCVNWDFKTTWVDISWWSWKEKVVLEELLKVQKLSENFVWFLVCWWHVIHFFLVAFIFFCYTQKHWEIGTISKIVCRSPHSWKMSNLDVHLLISWRESSIPCPGKGKSFFSMVTEMALSSRKCKPLGTLILCKFSGGLSPADGFTLWFCLNAVEGSRMYYCY